MPMEVASRGDVLTLDNPSKKKDLWKGKYDIDVHDRSQLQEKIFELQKEVDRMFGIQKEVATHGTTSVMVVQGS